MILPKKIRIREVGPREGFQILPALYKTKEKAELIDILSQSGLREIEVTSFVRQDRVPQMADAEELVKIISKKPGVTYTGLYLNPQGFLRAENTGLLENQAWINAACSETFLNKNSNTSLKQILSSLPEQLKIFQQAKKPLHGLMLSAAFGCNYEGVISAGAMLATIDTIIEELSKNHTVLKEICLADTMGHANPLSVSDAVTALRKKHPGIYISLHLHDTKGFGLANVFSALQLGVDCFDSSIGGLGGCPFAKGSSGNISTEQLVLLCNDLKIETGIDLNILLNAVKYLKDKLHVDVNSSIKLVT